MGKRKLTRHDLMEMAQLRQEGSTLKELCERYGVCKEVVKYKLRLMERHGYAILRENTNRRYSREQKEQAIREVLEERQSIGQTALKDGLSGKSALSRWIAQYEANGGELPEKRRGRPRKSEK